MLVISRNVNEGIVIGGDIRIVVTRLGGGQVSLGIEAPDDVLILREEMLRRDPPVCGTSGRPAASGWQWAWREGFQPQISTAGLTVLARALATLDPRLLRRAATHPSGSTGHEHCPVERADPVAFAYAFVEPGPPNPNMGGRCFGGCTVAQAEEWWARCCFEADLLLHTPGGCADFLGWWEDEPNSKACSSLWRVVAAEILRRQEERIADTPARKAADVGG